MEEKLETIAILAGVQPFQQSRRKTRGWRAIKVDLEFGLLEQGSRNAEHYTFWRNRLLTLYEAYRKANPTGSCQWWRDTRDATPWSTFWLAMTAIVLTLLFGLARSVTGIIQVYVAYHTLNCSANGMQRQ